MVRRRRGEIDSLKPVDASRWLVVRDRYSQVLHYRTLAPRIELRAAPQVKRTALAADGWQVDDIPRNCSFFFCERENERWCVSVDYFEPSHIPVSHG